MIKLPLNNSWTQPNNSDKFGSLWATKNINLDEKGYIKLSPRSVKLIDEAASENFGVPVAFGRFSGGEFQIGTTSSSNFVMVLNDGVFTITEDTGTANPTMTENSHAIFWQNRWHASTATTVVSKGASDGAGETWTSRITGLTSGVRHYMEVFDNRQTFCVTNGNVLKQYDTSYASSTDLTIPSDFEMHSIAYNNGKMGIIARPVSTAQKDAFLFTWDGSTTSAQVGISIESDFGIAIQPYKSSFVVLTRTGELMYFNGGGFETLATFPFAFSDKLWLSSGSITPFGDVMVTDGDLIYMNLCFELNPFGRNQLKQIPNNQSGVWCYDPDVGLYHRWSPSTSQLYRITVNDGGTDPSTNTITAATGTIPSTGNPIRYVRSDGVGIGGLTENQDYYIIKESSSTFKVAETKELALVGVAIDLTSDDTAISIFHAYDLVDYGNSFNDDTGAIALMGATNAIYRDIIFGGDFPSTTIANNDTLSMTVPFLENRGWFITSKIFSSGITENVQKLLVKFRKLSTGDAIVVKYRDVAVAGLPVSCPDSLDTKGIWTGKNGLYTTSDLSVAKTHFDAGNDLEIEFVAGVGAGQMVKITSIDEEDGTYSITTEEEVIGAAMNRESQFIIDNWKVYETITDTDKDYVEVPIGSTGSWFQFKIELRGVGTTIEELQIINATHKPSV